MARLAAGKCSSTFPFSFHRTRFCLCSGHSLKGLPIMKPCSGSLLSHTTPTLPGESGGHKHTHLPVYLQPLRLHSPLSRHKQGPCWQAACHHMASSLCIYPLHADFPTTFLVGGSCFHHGVTIHGCSVHIGWWKEITLGLKESLHQGKHWKKKRSVLQAQQGAEALAAISQPTVSPEQGLETQAEHCSTRQGVKRWKTLKSG